MGQLEDEQQVIANRFKYIMGKGEFRAAVSNGYEHEPPFYFYLFALPQIRPPHEECGKLYARGYYMPIVLPTKSEPIDKGKLLDLTDSFCTMNNKDHLLSSFNLNGIKEVEIDILSNEHLSEETMNFALRMARTYNKMGNPTKI